MKKVSSKKAQYMLTTIEVLVWQKDELKLSLPSLYSTDVTVKYYNVPQITQSLLDVILVSPNNSVRDSGVIHRPISDHSIVFVKLKVKKPKTTPQYITTRSYKKYNADLFVTDLANEADSLLSIFDQTDVDSM